MSTKNSTDPLKLPTEVTVLINGQQLSNADVLVLRVALGAFNDILVDLGLGPVGIGYKESVERILDQLIRPTLTAVSGDPAVVDAAVKALLTSNVPNESLLKEVVRSFRGSLGIEMTTSEAQSVLNEFSDLKSEIENMGKPLRDTEAESKLCNALTQKLIGKSVPTFRESPDFPVAFFMELHKAARKAGYDCAER